MKKLLTGLVLCLALVFGGVFAACASTENQAAKDVSVMIEQIGAISEISLDSRGEIEAARTLGYSRWQAFFQVVFPQARHQVMPLYKTQFVLTMQDTSVVSLLAVQDMTRAVTVITSRTMDPIISLVITSVVYLLLGFVANRMLSLADRNKHLTSKEAA